MKITLTLPEGVKPGQYTVENPIIRLPDDDAMADSEGSVRGLNT